MIAEQELSEENVGTWYTGVYEYLQMLKIDVNTVKESSKSTLKDIVKKQITERMAATMKEAKKKYKKMRFLNCEEFKLRQYIKDGEGNDAIQALKTRLNMRELYGNYKGDYTLPRLCPYCQKEEDTTEHLVDCSVFGSTYLTQKDLHDDENVEL